MSAARTTILPRMSDRGWDVRSMQLFQIFQDEAEEEKDDLSVRLLVQTSPEGEAEENFRIKTHGGDLDSDIWVKDLSSEASLGGYRLRYETRGGAVDLRTNTTAAVWEDIETLAASGAVVAYNGTSKDDITAEFREKLGRIKEANPEAGMSIRFAVRAAGANKLRLVLEGLPAPAKKLRRDSRLAADTTPGILLKSWLLKGPMAYTGIGGPIPVLFSSRPDETKARLDEDSSILTPGLRAVHRRLVDCRNLQLEEAEEMVRHPFEVDCRRPFGEEIREPKSPEPGPSGVGQKRTGEEATSGAPPKKQPTTEARTSKDQNMEEDRGLRKRQLEEAAAAQRELARRSREEAVVYREQKEEEEEKENEFGDQGSVKERLRQETLDERYSLKKEKIDQEIKEEYLAYQVSAAEKEVDTCRNDIEKREDNISSVEEKAQELERKEEQFEARAQTQAIIGMKNREIGNRCGAVYFRAYIESMDEAANCKEEAEEERKRVERLQVDLRRYERELRDKETFREEKKREKETHEKAISELSKRIQELKRKEKQYENERLQLADEEERHGNKAYELDDRAKEADKLAAGYDNAAEEIERELEELNA